MSAEPSREDRYEAAVRAVLDLCDREDRDNMGEPPFVIAEIRAAIRWELADRVDEDEPPTPTISGEVPC